MNLRPYQARLVTHVIDDVCAGLQEIVLAAAPGAGKTEMAFAVIRHALANGLASRVLVLAHGTTVLRRQFADRAVAEFGSAMVHEVGQGEFAPPASAKVLVALPQSLHRRADLPTCELVVVDEAHEFYDATMAKRVIARSGAKSVVLLTGSPSKFIARGVPLRSISMYEVMKECPGAFADPAIDLVASEFLIPYDRYNANGEVEGSFRYGKAQAKATLDGLLEKMVAHLPRRRGRAVSGWQETIHAMGKTIIACRSLALARQVEAYFRKRGVKAGLSTHQDDAGSEEIQRFKDDAGMPLLIVVRRAVLGFNFPELINLVDMTGTINIDRIFQMFARVVRPHPTKPKTRKLFVKMTPKGKMEAYTRDVVGAALQLGRKETFETYNGANLGGVVIPRWRGDRDREEAATRGPLVGPRKLRPLAKCFAASEFFEIVASMDSEFSLYAKTTLARARVAHFPAIRAMNGAWRGVSCSFSGCTREAVAVGLCDQHGNMHRRGEPLRPIGEARPRGIVACAFEGCGRRGSRRGLCVAHRKQQLKGNNLRPLKTPLPHGPCSFDACDKPRRSARGLCAAHARQHRMSESLRPLRFRMKGLDCEFTSCGRHAMRMGLCPAHAKQRAKGKDLTPIRTAANRRDLQ